MTPAVRYRTDPVFSRLVDMLKNMIETANLTPTEIREAAMLATIHADLGMPRSIMVVSDPTMAPGDWRLIPSGDHLNGFRSRDRDKT